MSPSCTRRTDRPRPLVSLRQWEDWAAAYDWLPAGLAVPDLPPPSRWNLAGSGQPAALLESGRSGRFTYLIPHFDQRLLAWADRAEIQSAEGMPTPLAGRPLELLERWVESFRAAPPPTAHPFAGGVVGLISYDLSKELESIPPAASDDLELPLLSFGLAREVLVYDHAESSLQCWVWRRAPADQAELGERYQEACERLEALRGDWVAWTTGSAAHSEATPPTELTPESESFTRAEFVDAAARVKEYIARGDTYQVNLSLRQTFRTEAGAEAIYDALRRINPSPYMGLLRMPHFSLVCGSPELLVSLRGGRAETRPIAGTRRRGRDTPQDAWLQQDLVLNQKERAEHLMLVDLMRNDLGRVCAFGSVGVPEFMSVERYSHVMHLVSQVEGRLEEGRTFRHLLQAVFPGGTITGAPKVRTMQIIEEIEPVRRHAYTGSLGWISFGGELQFNIVIRSLLLTPHQVHIQAGAGIVADSEPELEYEECLHKAGAMLEALRSAAGENRTAP